jgi:hypothetical protein
VHANILTKGFVLAHSRKEDVLPLRQTNRQFLSKCTAQRCFPLHENEGFKNEALNVINTYRSWWTMQQYNPIPRHEVDYKVRVIATRKI